MARYFHALKVVPEKCCGQLACMRVCPTQAIRVRNNKAVISDDLCVDCGACINACSVGAIVPLYDPIDVITSFKYNVIVPSPVLYSQFDASIHPYIIHLACKEIGFDEVVDVGPASEVLGRALIEFMKDYRGRFPLISSHCPAIVRLIQVKYPDLVELVLPLDVPRELTAREVRLTFPERLGLRPEEIGIIYAAPCPAKIVSIKQPAEKERSWFDSAVSISDIYSVLLPHVLEIAKTFDESQVPEDFAFHVGWAPLGGLTRTLNMENWLAVSGLDHATRIFDDIENSRLRNIDFVEALACMLGCIGGPYNVESPYVARTGVIKQRRKWERSIAIDEDQVKERLKQGYYRMNPLRPRPKKFFDTDLVTSIKRMKERERIYQKLPRKDCGYCGSPTCMAFAEDYVKKEVELTDCIYIAKELGSDEIKKKNSEADEEETP